MQPREIDVGGEGREIRRSMWKKGHQDVCNLER